MPGLHVQTAKGAVAVVNSLNYVDQLKAVGINDKQWQRLTGNKPWAAVERPQIEKLCKHLIFGMLDMIGCPRFSVPCEFVAGVGVSWIAECNYWAFASWVGSYARAEELGNYDGSRQGNIEGLEKCTSSQLFALMLELRSDEDIELMCRRFTDKTAEALEGFVTNEVEDEETEKK